VHGGFEHETPNIPINAIARIDTYKLFARHDHLTQKIKPIDNNKKGDKVGKDGIRKNPQRDLQLGNQKEEFRLAN
jgi:hypothetical protein